MTDAMWSQLAKHSAQHSAEQLANETSSSPPLSPLFTTDEEENLPPASGAHQFEEESGEEGKLKFWHSSPSMNASHISGSQIKPLDAYSSSSPVPSSTPLPSTRSYTAVFPLDASATHSKHSLYTLLPTTPNKPQAGNPQSCQHLASSSSASFLGLGPTPSLHHSAALHAPNPLMVDKVHSHQTSLCSSASTEIPELSFRDKLRKLRATSRFPRPQVQPIPTQTTFIAAKVQPTPASENVDASMNEMQDNMRNVSPVSKAVSNLRC